MLLLGIIMDNLALWIVSGVYHIAAWVFELFLVLSTGKLIDSNQYSTVIQNFYIILGIIMLFVISFAFLRGIVNPDDQKQGTSLTKKVVVNLITSSVIMALLPTIFSFAYDFQTSFILRQNTIGKFFGYGNVNSKDDNPSSLSNLETVRLGSFQIVNGVFTGFFNANMNNSSVNTCSDVTANCLIEAQNNISSNGLLWRTSFQCDGAKYLKNGSEIYYDNKSLACAIYDVDHTGAFGNYMEFGESIDDGTIDFNFLACLIGGIALCYVGFSFCFDMALRMIKLVFYQLIAPIPIFMRIIPEGKLSGMFNQWLKVTLTCYLEVYVRIFVFYFVAYLSNAIIETDFLSNMIIRYGFLLGILVKAFILMGLVMFMKQAPKLISSVTGLDSGNMKLGIREKLKEGGVFTAGAAIGGGISTLAQNSTLAWKNIREAKGGLNRYAAIRKGAGSIIAGTFSGAFRAGKAGLNAKNEKDMVSAASAGTKAAIAARDKRARYKAYHPEGVLKGHISDNIQKVQEWAGLGVSDAELDYYVKAAQTSKSLNDASEGTYKTSTEYQELNAKAKEAKARVTAFLSNHSKVQNYTEAMKQVDDIEKTHIKGNESALEDFIKTGSAEAKEKLLKSGISNGTIESYERIQKGKALIDNYLNAERLVNSYSGDKNSKEYAALLAGLNNAKLGLQGGHIIDKDIKLYEGLNNYDVMKSAVSSLERDNDILEYRKLLNDSENIDSALNALRIDKSKTKTGPMAVTATKLAVDQKTNYSGDLEMTNSYNETLKKVFKVNDLNVVTKTIDIKDNYGNIIEKGVVVGDYKNKDGEELDARTCRILDALRTGNAVNMEDLDVSIDGGNNLVNVQEFIDQINIDRQRRMNKEMAKNVAAKGNRPSEKGEK